MCVRKLTDASLMYRTKPKTKTNKIKTNYKYKNGYAQKKRCRARNHVFSPVGEGSLGFAATRRC